jgi:hypothetical protein
MHAWNADTFTDSLARLAGGEHKPLRRRHSIFSSNPANPANPEMNFHRLDEAQDKNFWSVRVGSDIRLIVHKTQSSLLLCYVSRHDKAYDWVERRKRDACQDRRRAIAGDRHLLSPSIIVNRPTLRRCRLHRRGASSLGVL